MILNSSVVKPRKNPISQAQVCHVVASINEDVGGPSIVVANLAESVANQVISSHLFTLDYQEVGSQIPTRNVKLYSYPANFLARYVRGFAATSLAETIDFTGLFMQQSRRQI